ncbi:MAG: stage III sporulation AC/AD family protein [Oscillospiraceae bacterium]|nr:stage III sporulation AC/AD family protein [Oscillospiraceae bacterium]
MDILLKCAAAAITAAVLGLVLKKNNPETALLLGTGAAVALLAAVFTAAEDVFGFLGRLIDVTGLPDGIVPIVLKTVAVAVITGLVSDICKDAGQAALSSACEVAGAMTAMYIAMPLFEIVLETMGKLM